MIGVRDTSEVHQSGSRGRSTRAIARLRPASTQSFASTWIFRNSCLGWQEIFLNVLSFLSFQKFHQTRAKIDLQDFALSFPMEAFVRCHQLTRKSSWTAAIAGVMFSLQSVRCQTSFAKEQEVSRWAAVSGSCRHSKHSGLWGHPRLGRLSAVRHRSWAANQTKNWHLGGASELQASFA